MSRFLVGLAAVLLAVPAAVGVPIAATPAAAPAGYAPVVQVSPADRDNDDDDGDHHKKKSSKKQKSKHTEDIDVSQLSEEEVAVLGTALVIAALAAVV